MSRPLTQDSLPKKIRDLERSADASTGLFPQEGLFKWAEYSGVGGGIAVPNTAAYIFGTGMTITIATLGQQEVWVFHASLIVRANSANDSIFRARIMDTTSATEIGVGYVQRVYWNGGSNSLSGYSTVPIQGRAIIPANTSRTYEVQIQSGSNFGGNAYEGGPTHNNLFAQRVA